MISQYSKRRLIIVFIFIALIIIIQYIGFNTVFSLENIKAKKDYLFNFVQQNYFKSVIAYISFFILCSFLSIPVTIVLNLLAGFLFGAIIGAFYVNIGTTVGGTLSFLVFRYFLGVYIQDRYKDQLKEFNKHIEKEGYNYLLMLQIFPATPTFLINSLSGLTKLRLWTFVWTTSVGIFPGSLIYTFAGQQLGKIESTKDILSWPIIVSLILLSLLALLPLVIRKLAKS